MTVQNFDKIVWTVFENFELSDENIGRKKTKKRHDCISSRKIFFRLLKVEKVQDEVANGYNSKQDESLKIHML